MILDALNALLTPANANAQLGAVGSTFSDVIDLGPLYGNYRDIAPGRRLKLRIQVETTASSGGAATLQVNYGDSSDSAGVNFVTRYATPVTPVANLPQGTVLADIGLPDNFQRYLMAQVNVAGAAFTGGALRATILEDSDTQPPANAYSTAIPATGF